jgi:hypothetical protein
MMTASNLTVSGSWTARETYLVIVLDPFVHRRCRLVVVVVVAMAMAMLDL